MSSGKNCKPTSIDLDTKLKILKDVQQINNTVETGPDRHTATDSDTIT